MGVRGGGNCKEEEKRKDKEEKKRQVEVEVVGKVESGGDLGGGKVSKVLRVRDYCP